jgi:hypothetical protein
MALQSRNRGNIAATGVHEIIRPEGGFCIRHGIGAKGKGVDQVAIVIYIPKDCSAILGGQNVYSVLDSFILSWLNLQKFMSIFTKARLAYTLL